MTSVSERARQGHLAGGVSAAARIHASLGRPFMTARGEGGWVWDVDGNGYVDLNTSNGAALLGHGHPAVRGAVEQALDLGILCAHETAYQAEVAAKIAEWCPSAELVRFTGSGTETTWHAIRTARAFTGRSKVVKFEGHSTATTTTSATAPGRRWIRPGPPTRRSRSPRAAASRPS